MLADEGVWQHRTSRRAIVASLDANRDVRGCLTPIHRQRSGSGIAHRRDRYRSHRVAHGAAQDAARPLGITWFDGFSATRSS
jgi:hypothetical protein